MRDKNTDFHQNNLLNIGGRLMDLSTPRVMGILNLTPDSFYDGGRYIRDKAALQQVEQMLAEGADMIDIGAYSSRPGAADISIAEEKERLLPVVEQVLKQFPGAVISVDTFRSEVAKAALDSGAHIINDISAGELDKEMFNVIASYQVPYIIMHMKGNPQNMQQQANYVNLLDEVLEYFIHKTEALSALGVKDLIIDPGFGFAKNNTHNFALLNDLDALRILKTPFLAGVSRKSMIWKTLEISPDDALNGTAVLNTVALMKGAAILRVHDVKPAVEAVKLISRLGTQ